MPERPTCALISTPGSPAMVTRCTPGRPSGGYGQSGPGTAVGWVGPGGARGVGEPVDVFHGDDGHSGTYCLDREPDGGHSSRRDGHHRALDRFWRRPGFVPFANVVELDAEAVGKASDLAAPQGCQHAGPEDDRCVVGCGTES